MSLLSLLQTIKIEIALKMAWRTCLLLLFFSFFTYQEFGSNHFLKFFAVAILIPFSCTLFREMIDDV